MPAAGGKRRTGKPATILRRIEKPAMTPRRMTTGMRTTIPMKIP
jgi:hypothetical protein